MKAARPILAIVVGAIVWVAVATAGNVAFRWLLPGYADAEKPMTFSPGMLVARLLLGAAASLFAGAACVAVARSVRTVYGFGFLLLALFVPLHVSLWDKFPVWYHILFLGSLAPLVVLGAKLRDVRSAGAH